MRLSLDAHTFIAFHVGSVLRLKSAVKAELIQTDRSGATAWRADDGASARQGRITIKRVGTLEEVALAASLVRAAMRSAKNCIEQTWQATVRDRR
ncbi:MAG: hypothetical protein EON56_04910 [Alphaproteobacteria bacterium]|nr:MAG: hypothetical protein EON56_04910 [Alphaproteobacteria bacterium]